MRRSRTVRVTHAEIDNIFAAPTRSHFQFSGDVKNVGRETINARKATFRASVSHNFLRLTLAPGPSERRCHNGGCFENSLINFCLSSVLEHFLSMALNEELHFKNRKFFYANKKITTNFINIIISINLPTRSALSRDTLLIHHLSFNPLLNLWFFLKKRPAGHQPSGYLS